MGDWVSADDVRTRFGAARVDTVASIRAGQPGDLEEVIDAAIDDAESVLANYIKRYSGTISDVVGANLKTVKRLAGNLSWCNLHDSGDAIPPAVTDLRARTMEEVKAIASGSARLSGDAEETRSQNIHASTDEAGSITLESLEEW